MQLAPCEVLTDALAAPVAEGEERAAAGRGALGGPAVRVDGVGLGEVGGVVLVEAGAPDDVGALHTLSVIAPSHGP